MTPHHNEEIKLEAMFLLAQPFEIPTLRLFKRNTGVVRIEKRVIRFAIKGQCDCWGVFDGGRHVEVELKALRGRLSPEQRDWRDFCLARRIPYMLAIEKKGESHEATVARWIEELRKLA